MWSDHIEVITYDNANEVIEENLNHFFQDTNWFRNINEWQRFYFRFSSPVVIQTS